MGIRISKDHLHPSVIESITSLIGDLNQLETTAKGNAVEAINELLANGGNKEELEALIAEITEGKELIANAVGEPLTAEESFDEMSNDINSLLSTFKTNMMNNGVTVNSSDRFKQLIDKIATMVEEGSNKGIQFATGTGVVTKHDTGSASCNINDLAFTPTYVFCYFNKVYANGSTSYLSETVASNLGRTLTDKSDFKSSIVVKINGNSFNVSLTSNVVVVADNFTYYAIGVGEEDTTLRDSLASILGDKGIDVTEEDDMASLITKVDERIVDIDIKDLFCGYGSSFLLKKDNSLWGCGLAANIGTTSNMNTFTHLMDDVKQVACNGSNGAQHVMVLKNDGSLWCCGDNGVGQLGLGNTTLQKTFTQVTTGVKEVHCGAQFTYIIKNDNTLWSCGYNSDGQLGLGTSSSGDFKKSFSQVTVNVSDIKQFGCSFNNAWMLKNDGTLWATGLNSNDMLGLGNTNSRNTFTQIATNVNQIFTGVSGSVFITKNDGTLWGAGYNYYGQLGVGYTNSTDATAYQPFTKINIDANDVKTIATGHTFTVLLKKNGSLWGCGYDSHNELGSIYPSTNKYVFTSISNINNNLDVRCSLDHVLVLKNDNKIWVAGNNYSGQLGLGYNTTSGNVSGFLCYGGSF